LEIRLKARALTHQRFYFPPDALEAGSIRFQRGESSHMTSSLRLTTGDRVSATDGQGRVYEVAIDTAKGGNVVGTVLKTESVERPAPSIFIFQGLCRSSSMGTALEKCVELGIDGFVPVAVERSVRPLGERRLERLRRVAVEAMKQSLGAYLPEVHAPQTFEDALGVLSGFDLALVASELERQRTLIDVERLTEASRIAAWIGPEGGFTETETRSLCDRGAVTFSLGDHRLRSETAAIATVAAIRTLCSPQA
jgi:16S rRNA (uracil1498-N3)-methyltransferase